MKHFVILFFCLLQTIIFVSCGSDNDGDPSTPAWIDCYTDADGDSYGDLNSPQTVAFNDYQNTPGLCVIDANDCDDGNPAINPGQDEILDNGIDDDCNSETTDEATTPDESTPPPDETPPPDDDTPEYTDADGDGFTSDADCDDADPERYPTNTEVCDDKDNDCDETVDEDATDAKTWFVDADGDAYGSASTLTTACDKPDGFADNDDDCNDGDPDINPGETDDPQTITHEDCSPFTATTTTGPLHIPNENEEQNEETVTEPTYAESVFLRGLAFRIKDDESTKISALYNELYTVNDSQFYVVTSLSTPDELEYSYETRYSSAQYDTSIMKVHLVSIAGYSNTSQASITAVSLAEAGLEGFDKYAVALVGISFYTSDTIKWGVVEAETGLWNPLDVVAQKETISGTDPSVVSLKTLYPYVDTRFEGSLSPSYNYSATLAIIGIKTSSGAVVKTDELETDEIQNGETDTVTENFGTYDENLEYLPLLNKISLDVSTGWIDTAAKMRHVDFEIEKENKNGNLKIKLSGIGDFHNNADDIVYTAGVTVIGIPNDKLWTQSGTVAGSGSAMSALCNIQDSYCSAAPSTGSDVPNDHAPELEAQYTFDDDTYHPGDEETFYIYTESAECREGLSIILKASDEDVEDGGAAPVVRGFVDLDYCNGYLIELASNGDAYPYENTNHDVAQMSDDYFTEENGETVFSLSFEALYGQGICDLCDDYGMRGVKLYFDATDGEKTTEKPITFELPLSSTGQCD